MVVRAVQAYGSSIRSSPLSRWLLCLVIFGTCTGSRAAEPAAKYLIIHADDAGMSHSANTATIEALEMGIVTSASIMVPCPWFPEFAAYAKEHPQYDYGIHLTLNCEWNVYKWGPVAPRDKVPSLVDPQGYLWKDVQSVARNVTTKEAEIELKAQIDKARQFGVKLSHLDTHMGALVSRPDLLELYVKLGIEYDLPVLFIVPRNLVDRLAYPVLAAKGDELGRKLKDRGLPVLDHLVQFYSGEGHDERRQRYLDALHSLQPGVTQLIIHCGVDNEELRHITESAARRDSDRRVFTDPAIGEELARLGIKTISWKQFRELRGGERASAADLVLRGGKVVTMDAMRPEAQAVAVRGERIAAVGSDEEVAARIGPQTRVIELKGKLVVPGFIEGHGHFLSLGEKKLKLDVSEAATWDEVVARVAEAAKGTPKSKWIEGRGWHQGKWKMPPEPSVQGYPVADALSRVSPDNPVVLTHGTGHMCLANAKAMELAGVNSQTKAPDGGEILRDASGRPTGVFRETAMILIYRVRDRALRERTAKEVRDEQLEAVRLATEECLKHGVTSFQDAGSSCEDVDLFKELAGRGELKVRLWVMLNDSNDMLARRLSEYRLIGYGNNHLTVRAIKRMADGALGTHGAWLLEPYDDLPGSTGLNVTPLAALRETAELAIQNEYQLCVHAIGDRANREVLDLMEAALRQHPEKKDLRWRVEHVQHLHPDDIPRFARLGAIASMQANHATSDGPFVVQRLGQRRAREGAYAWRGLLDAKALVINGTDVPVEKIDPIACYFSSVTRQMADGATFFPEQAMTREEALRSYTASAAYAAFEEADKGSIAQGKLADLVILSGDLLKAPAAEIPHVRVEKTIVGGRILYER